MTNTDPTTSAREVSKSIRTTDETWNRFKAFAASRGVTTHTALVRLLDNQATVVAARQVMDALDVGYPQDLPAAVAELIEVRNSTVAGGGHE